MAKLQKSFQDYFRIPILLKTLGGASLQNISFLTDVFNTIQPFPIQGLEQSFLLNLKNSNIQLTNQLGQQILNRPTTQKQKLLFIPEQMQTDWPQFQFIYKSKFIIAVYEPNFEKPLIESLERLKKNIKEENSKLLGIIFLNDQKNQAPNLSQEIKFIILPSNLSGQQTAVFIQPWLQDSVATIQQHLVSYIFQYRQQENTAIVFNKNEEKSEQKIMKKKKKYRCVKLCGDISLMLHLYKLAYQTYNQAQQQLRKIDDYLWTLGCIQGKLACMTSQFYIPIQIENFDQKVQQLIQQSNNLAKKVKQTNLQIQNSFKILKLFMDEPQKFQQMLQNIMLNIKLTTEEQKFTYFVYIGSLYEKCGMIRKRNYYYYLSSLIYLNIKTDISLILLKKIKQSHDLKQWEQLHSKIIKLIIDQQGFFNKSGQLQLQLLQQCRSVLSKKDIQITLENLNFNNYKEINLKQNYSIVEVKQFNIEESKTKPKLNRIGNVQSPKKSSSTIFMGWKKNQNFLFQQDEPVVFKGTVFNKMTFSVHLIIKLQISNIENNFKIFQLLLNPLSSVKFVKQFTFKYCQQPIQIKSLQLKVWNFIFCKELKPMIKFQTYQKQPKIDLILPSIINIQQSQSFSVKSFLSYQGEVKCEKIRLTVCVYYDIDVGFQQNQYEIQKQFLQSSDVMKKNKQNPLIFTQSQQNQNSLNLNEKKEFIFILKKLKAQRKHVKRLQITLQYIENRASKYQIMKQYSISTQIINSIWGKIIPFEHYKNYPKTKSTSFQIQQFYLARVQFFKNSNNLAPYKIKYNSTTNSQQIILSDKTTQFFDILLPKILQKDLNNYKQNKVNCKQTNQSLTIQTIQKQNIAKDLIFYWQNIVSPQINGKIVIKQQIHEEMLRPSYKIIVKTQKKQQNQHIISYSIQAKNNQTLSHHLLIKQLNEDLNQFVIKGKVKVQNTNRKNNIQNCVTIKFIQKKLKTDNIQIMAIVQFQNKWRYKQIIKL